MILKVGAAIGASLRPGRSHVVVLWVGITGSLSLFASFLFLWFGKSEWVFPAVVGSVLLLAAIVMWLLSHRDQDMIDSRPTSVTDPGTGLAMTMDARNMSRADASKVFAEVVTRMAYRRALPEPDGLVAADGRPDPGRRDEAVRRVQQANMEVQAQDDDFVRRFHSVSAAQSSRSLSEIPRGAIGNQNRDSIDHVDPE
jgi:hypothetical protein